MRKKCAGQNKPVKLQEMLFVHVRKSGNSYADLLEKKISAIPSDLIAMVNL
jgi:hypothetical protein